MWTVMDIGALSPSSTLSSCYHHCYNYENYLRRIIDGSLPFHDISLNNTCFKHDAFHKSSLCSGRANICSRLHDVLHVSIEQRQNYITVTGEPFVRMTI